MTHPRTTIRKAFSRMVEDAWPKAEVRTSGTINAEDIEQLGKLQVVIVGTPSEERDPERSIEGDLAFSGDSDTITVTVEVTLYLSARRDDLYDTVDEFSDRIERRIASADAFEWPAFMQALTYEAFEFEESLENIQDVAGAVLRYSVVYDRGDLRDREDM